MRRVACIVAVVLSVVLARSARAHDVAPAVVVLEEQTTLGDYRVRFVAGDETTANDDAALRLPRRCRREGVLARCGVEGLTGTLRITGLSTGQSAIVWIHRTNGRSTTYVLSGPEHALVLDEGRAPRATFVAALKSGVTHFAVGADHIFFVTLLVLARRTFRGLLLAMTTFTVAHALTFMLRAMSVVSISSAWVELVIALSVCLLAADVASRKAETGGRESATIGFAFIAGLVHGLGFASALNGAEVARAMSLEVIVGFNLGLELAQLALVVVLTGLLASMRDAWRPRTESLTLEAIGAMSGYLVLDRLFAFSGIG